MVKHIPASRTQQAQKIIRLLLDGIDSRDKKSSGICLDIGCGTGEIGKILAPNFQFVIGIEIDLNRIKVDDDVDTTKRNFFFTQANGANLPFDDDSFDFIICAQVYEHTVDQIGLVKEIWRVLKKDGICFFSGPNKFTIIEEHYFLPCLSWFPSKMSDLYLKLFTGNNHYDIYPLSHRNLLKLLQNFYIEDTTIQILKNPRKYGMIDRFGILNLLRFVPELLIKPFLFFIPNFNWIIKKKFH